MAFTVCFVEIVVLQVIIYCETTSFCLRFGSFSITWTCFIQKMGHHVLPKYRNKRAIIHCAITRKILIWTDK